MNNAENSVAEKVASRRKKKKKEFWNCLEAFEIEAIFSAFQPIMGILLCALR